MSVVSSFDATAQEGYLELHSEGLCLSLSRKDALHLYHWLGQSIDSNLSFLLRIDCDNYSIEGRNYNDYLDFLIYVHEESGMSARTFTIPKDKVASIVIKFKLAMEESFLSS